MIGTEEEWIALCEMDENGEICFTQEYLDVIGDLGGGARKFASHMISHWDLELQSLLDYFGPPDLEEDLYSGIDGEAMDVREDICDVWEYYDALCPNLEADWYRDILRAKLLTIKIPKRLINEYIKAVKENEGSL